MGFEQLIESEIKFQGKLLTLRSDIVKLKTDNGRTVTITREIVEHRPIVVLIAVDNESNVLLVKQHRYATGCDLLEVPAGGIEEGEIPEFAALRELREETGYSAEKISPLGKFWAAPGWCTEYMYGFLMEDLKFCPSEADEDEDIELVRIPWSQVPELIKNGEIEDAKSIASLLSALFLGFLD